MTRNGNGNSISSVTSSVAPWLVALLGFVGFFWQLVSPRDDLRAIEHRLDEKVSQLEVRMHEADASLERIINLNALDVKDRVPRAEHGEFVKRKDLDTSRLEDLIRMLAQNKMNKEDEAKDVLNLNERLVGLRGEVQDIRANITGSANIGKTVDHIQQEIDDMRKPIMPMPLKP